MFSRSGVRLIHQLMIANQCVLIFDLKLTSQQRSLRRSYLDKILADYFASQNLTSHIVHQLGQQATLTLTSQDTKHCNAYYLTISYALPFVAVSWSQQALGIDLVAVADFENIQQEERQSFAHLYFPTFEHATDILLLARKWASFEAKLKLLQLPLQEWTPSLDSQLAKASSVEKLLSLPQSDGTTDYWISMAHFKA